MTDAPVDWPPGDGEMARRTRGHDWAATPLGPIATWAPNLRTAVDIMLSSGHAMQLAWGEERTVLYNDAYAPMLGERHPSALGIPFRDAWPDVWDEIEPMVARVFAGETIRFENMPLVMTRNGFREHTWWNFSYSPVRDAAGAVAGLLNVTVDASARVRAERAEREQDLARRLQSAMLDVLPVGLGLHDTDGRVVLSNPQWDRFMPSRLLPSRDAERGGRWRATDSDGRPLEPTDYPGARALRGERCLPGIEFLYTDDAGRQLWTNVASVPLSDSQGRVVGAVSIVMDVDEAKRTQDALRASEERQAFLLKLSDALRPLSEASEIKAVAMRVLGEHLGVLRAQYYEFDESGEFLDTEPGYAVGVPPAEGRVRPDDFGPYIRENLAAARTLAVSDVETDPRVSEAERRAYRALGFRAFVGAPLVKAGRPVVVLGLHHAAPHDWTEAELSLTQETADRTWAAVERARSEVLRRRAEELNAFLVQFSDEVRELSDPGAVAEVACGLVAGALGTERAYWAEVDWANRDYVIAAVHAPGGEVIANRFPFEAWEPFSSLQRAGRPVVVDDTQGSPEIPDEAKAGYAALGIGADLSVPVVTEGRLRCVFAVNQRLPRRWTAEEVAVVQGIAARCWTEVERARAEASLRESEERQAFLLRLSDALRPVADPGAVEAEACRLLAEHLRVDRAWYVEVDEAAGRTRVARDFVRDGASSLAGRHDMANCEWTLECLRRGECHVVADTRTSAAVPDAARPALAALGVISCMCAPLIREGRLAGALCVAGGHPREWSAGEVRLLREVVERTWAAIGRARAEEALRQSEERFRGIVEAARDYAIFTTDAEGLIDTWPAGAQAVFGWTEEEAVGQPLAMTFTPEDRKDGAPERERQGARERGQAPDVRWHLRKDGRRVFIEGMVRPLPGPAGSVRGYLKVGRDATARRAIETALRESEERLRQFGEASPDVLWIRNAETLAWEYLSPAFERIYGENRDSVLSGDAMQNWLGIVVPQDRERVRADIEKVRRGQRVTFEYRITRPSDGSVRLLRNTDFPIFDAEGHVIRIGGVGHDATEEVELQDRLEVLVAELQHRSRNLVGVVRGMTQRALATSESLDGFRASILPRLDALGRVNGLLSRLEEGDRITFDQLLQTELRAHGLPERNGGAERIALSGPAGIRLQSATVQTFALALHELATNAVKHGALSRPEGRLEVTWGLVPGLDDVERLKVDWRETGVPVEMPDGAEADPDAPPPRQGFGRELIERALPYQLRARTSYELTPDGVRCTIVVPVSSSLDLAFSSHGSSDA